MALISREPSTTSETRRQALDAQTIFETLKPVVHCLGELLGNACEVVLHDLRKPEASIVAIANGHVTGRRVGGPILGGPLDDPALAWLHQPGETNQVQMYSTRATDGRRLKSATVLYRDITGQPLAALCMNYDISVPIAMERFLRSLTDLHPAEASSGQASSGQTSQEAPDPVDVEAMVGELIENCVAEVGVAPERMTKQQRFKVVERLDQRGVFLIRGVVQRVARALGVSKFTIYSYLDELRNS